MRRKDREKETSEETFMTCPYCETEMEQGFIQGIRGVIWSKYKKRLFLIAEDDDIDIATGFWFGSYAAACHCRKCKKIIIDYNAK